MAMNFSAVNEEEVEVVYDHNNRNVNSKGTVVVTGASGFVASWTITHLCQKGYNVVGTVRGDPSSDRYEWITALDKSGNNLLRLAQANLLTEGAFDSIIKNADYVLHIASPYITTPKDVQKDLIDPAVNGTLNVLNSCLKSHTLKKVVVTSSFAAITDSPVKKYTEKDWNTTSSLTRNAYYYSKVLAEKAAWKLYENNNPKWSLCTANPWMVVGPELAPNPKKVNQSNSGFVRFINGAFPVRFNFSLGYVDVRDVALAHILIMEVPSSEGRHIIAAEPWHWNDLFDYLEEICVAENIECNIPSTHCDCACCCCLVHCIACTQDKGTADFMHNSINKVAAFDNSKIRNLGLNFRPFTQTLKETVVWLKEEGFVTTK